MAEEVSIFDAVRAGDVARVRAFVTENPALVNSRNERGHSPLLIAQYRHQREIVRLLLTRQPTLDVFDAAAVGRSGRVKELLTADLSLVAAWSADGFTALHLAAYFGHEEAVRVLLGHGADAHAVSRNAMKVQPLHSAAAGAHRDTVKLLLSAGADVNAPQQGGWTPLHAAARAGDIEIARMMMSRNGDPKRQADDGRSPIGVAAELGDVEILKVLKSE